MGVIKNASIMVVNVKDFSEPELLLLTRFYKRLSDLAKEEKELFFIQSVDEPKFNQQNKLTAPTISSQYS